jgi:hypothetical protein
MRRRLRIQEHDAIFNNAPITNESIYLGEDVNPLVFSVVPENKFHNTSIWCIVTCEDKDPVVDELQSKQIFDTLKDEPRCGSLIDLLQVDVSGVRVRKMVNKKEKAIVPGYNAKSYRRLRKRSLYLHCEAFLECADSRPGRMAG